MKHRYLLHAKVSIAWVVFVLLLNSPAGLYSQATLFTSEPGDELYEVEMLAQAGLYDRALTLVEPLYQRLVESEQTARPKGIRVRLLLGYLKQKTNEEEEAVALLLPLIEDARRAGLRQEQVHAMLTLASIYTGTRQFEKSSNILDQSEALIRQYGLDAERARYAIRRCSHYSLLRQIDSVRHYAHLALDQAKRVGQPWEQAHAYTLLNDAYPDTTYLFYLDNLRHFADYHREVENYTVVSQANTVMSIYLRVNDRLDEAMSLNDSTFYYLAAMKRRGQDDIPALSGAHRERMRIFEARSRPDSALYHSKKYFEYEKKYREQRSEAAIREVEAKYADNIKASKILQQEAQLRQRRREQLQLLLILSLIGMAALLLFYFNRKLERVNRSLADQSAELEQTNRELEVSLEHEELLRGELHHRVKNNLQVIISMLDLQEWNTDNPGTKSSLRAMSERIYSIASVHELLYPDRGGERIDFGTYLRKLCNRAAGLWPSNQLPEFQLEAPEVSMNLDTLVPLGVVVSELLTNTRKYFGSVNRPPIIRIALYRVGEEWCLEYLDNGPGFSSKEMPDRVGGLGKYLLNGMSRQLQGRVETFNDKGAGTRFYFLLKNMELSTKESAATE